MRRWATRGGAGVVWVACALVLATVLDTWPLVLVGAALVAGLWEGVWQAHKDERGDGT